MIKKEEPIPEVEQLRSFKVRSGWSYNKISSHMGIHSQTIYFWLSGRYKPSNLALEKIKSFSECVCLLRLKSPCHTTQTIEIVAYTASEGFVF